MPPNVTCTREITAKITTTVQGGTYPEVAAMKEGVDVATFVDWMQRGERGEQPYAAFVAQIGAAEAHAEALATTSAMQAIQASPAAALGFLERRFGRRWATAGPTSEGSRSWLESAFPGRGGGSIHRGVQPGEQAHR